MAVASRGLLVAPDPALPDQIEAAASRMHRQGVAATGDGRPATGARRLRRGLALLGWVEQSPAATPAGSTRDALVGRLLISLAYAEAEQGRTRYGFQLLDTATALVAPKDEGVLLQQRALLLYRTGRYRDAIAYFDRAIPRLTSVEHEAVLCPTLLNRASVHLHNGRIRAARDDLTRCENLARRLGLGVLAAKALHNRGYCELLVGHLPRALAAFEAAESLYRQHAPGFLPVLTAAKARALLAAGLCREAGRSLDEAIAAFRRQRLTQEQAEAELLRAQAALHSAEYLVASAWARRAERRFRRRGNLAWAELAALTRLRADLPGTGRPQALANRAARVGARLREIGLSHEEEMARLVAVRALLAAGRQQTAREQTAALPRRHTPVSLELLLTRRVTGAEVASSVGDRRRALAEIRSGLSALRHNRSRLGSVDLQVGIAALGRELAGAGLDAAFDGGSAAEVFAWSEQSRAQAFQVPPVHPPADPEVAEALAELRHLRGEMRTAQLQQRRSPGMQARCVELERLIRERAWQVGGPGHSTPVTGPGEIIAELAATGRMLVSLLIRRGRLMAVIADHDRMRIVELGDHAVVRGASARLLADLDVLAGYCPRPIEQVIRASIRQQVTLLTAELLPELRAVVGDRELVIVPTRTLSSIPWGLLPDLAGRPVTVSPSASVWLAARRAGQGRTARTHAGPALVVAGPGLQHAEVEIDEVAKAHPGSRCLTGSEATVAATLDGLDGAEVVHLAAHGHHEAENVLFSRLDLADGPLMAYDIRQLATPPRHVTLSACDVGRAVVRPGDEILGFTAALLYAGTPSVVSCVARVTHTGAAAVMARYHQAIAAGTEPARALADAAHSDPVAPFVCFGAG